MVNTAEFDRLVAGTIMQCQRIEHDVKIIYAAMLKGDYDDNFGEVRNLPLGDVLRELNELDNSDGNPYLRPEEYRLLDQIRTVRNWLVHQSYADFIYDRGRNQEYYFSSALDKLRKFNREMITLAKQTELVRLECLKDFGRI